MTKVAVGKVAWRFVLVTLVAACFFSAGEAVLSSPDDAPAIQLNSKNPHYFLFRGRTVALITSGEHYGAVLNADFDYKKYLLTLEADGLNYTRLFGGSYVEVPGKSFGIQRNDLAPAEGRFLAPWMRSSVPGYAGGGSKFDLSQWNPEYFRRYRDFLAEASSLGIVVEVTLFSSQYGEMQWNFSPFNPANNINTTDSIDWKDLQTLDNGSALTFQEQYTRKLVREANGFDNVFFEIQNEPWSDQPALVDVVNPYLRPPGRDLYPNSVELANAESLAWQAKVANWIASEEAPLQSKHLIAQNYANFRFPVRDLLWGVSIVNFHYAYPEAVRANYGLDKAIGYDETGFLGRDDAAYRRQAWNFMLSGGSTFDSLDYSFSPGHEDGSDTEPNGPGGGSAALRRQLGILQRFLTRFVLVNLRPDERTVKHAAGVTAHVLSNPGEEYAIYFDGSGPTQATFELPRGHYTCEWIDVATGETLQTESFATSGEKTLQSPKFTNGIAMRLVSVNDQ
jgi:hypothetical protein